MRCSGLEHKSGVVVRVHEACKRFEDVVALRDVSCTIQAGKLVLLLGENGAGKSTLLKSIAGLVPLDSGAIDLGVGNDAAEVRIGYVPQQVVMSEHLTARDLLKLAGTLNGLGGRMLRQRICYVADLFGLERLDEFPRAYSGGMVKRLLLALSVLPEPALLLLDEVLEGLDCAMRETALGLLSDWTRRGKVTVLMATHALDSYEGIYDEALLLQRGEVIWSSSRKQGHMSLREAMSRV